MKYLINYSDKNFEKKRNFSSKVSKFRGKFDIVIKYGPEDIDENFRKQNSNILNQKRGGGYWLWKPYIILKTLEKLNENDYLFYCDSGAYFLKDVDILINELVKNKQDIMGFELPLIESQWTKKELFINMNLDEEKFYKSNQILASFMLIKKTDLSMKFFKEYLGYSCIEINITDKYTNEVKQRNNFIDHRHDQSIFSLLYKKYNLKPFKDPSQFGEYPHLYSGLKIKKLKELKKHFLKNKREMYINKYLNEYKEVVHHNRKEMPIRSLLKYNIKKYLKLI